MTMVIENQGRQYGNMGYPDGYSAHLHSQPQFTDPWGSSSSSHATSYATSMPKQEPRSMPLSFPQLTSSAPSMSSSTYSSSGYGSSDLQNIPQEIPRSTYASEPSYQPTAHNTAPFSSSNFSPMNYAQSLHQQQQHQQSRKMSNHSDHASRAEPPSFGELDASRGMLALSHQNLTDLTPRNIFEARNGQSADGYGFPASSQHSLNSSISGPSSHRDSYPYYSASVASADSNTDYSSAASDAGFDSLAAARTLPRPPQLIGANLGAPAPQGAMMSSFSSRTSSNTQKKHKCKVCDKRFTRPSSLQTHMYSHTGEKPFACSVEGCGRHFSVVSNLRRHKKVHKGEAASSGHSEDDE